MNRICCLPAPNRSTGDGSYTSIHDHQSRVRGERNATKREEGEDGGVAIVVEDAQPRLVRIFSSRVHGGKRDGAQSSSPPRGAAATHRGHP